MNQQEYMAALKLALADLPADVIARTMTEYEQRFDQGRAAGRSEEEIATDLEDPKALAAKLKAATGVAAFQQQKNPANFWRMLISILGLFVFNMFMIVPAIVFFSMLLASFLVSLGLFFGGIAFTASSLSGSNNIIFDGPSEHVVIKDWRIKNKHTHVEIGQNGVKVYREEGTPNSSASNSASGSSSSASGSPSSASGSASGSVAAASADMHISSRQDRRPQAGKAFGGICLILFGILWFLLNLVISKFTLIGIVRYIQMNFSLLKSI